MRDREINYVIIAVLSIFWFVGFLMILDSFENQKVEINRLSDELRKTRKEMTMELENQRKELAVNNAICDAIITGSWE